MGTTPSTATSLPNSNNALPGNIRLANTEEDDDEPPGSTHHSRTPRGSEVTTTVVVDPIESPKLKSDSQPAGSHTLAREAIFNASTTISPHSAINAARSHTRQEQRNSHTRMARLRTLFVPSHPVGPSPGFGPSLKSAITYTPLNICLAFIPVSWALHYSHQSDTLTFICSSLAIVPLAAQLTLATEQISLRTSQAVGGLVNATFGNIVEMIIGGIALGRVCLALYFLRCTLLIPSRHSVTLPLYKVPY